jgi:hypothetical protein
VKREAATRVYVSAYEISQDGPDGQAEHAAPSLADAGLFVNRLDQWQTRKPGLVLPRRGLELARRLRGAGVQIVWYLDYWDYPAIEDEIGRSHALLAMTDTYYFSSTGKAIELTYAGGQLGSGARPRISPIPVLVFPIDDAHLRYRHLEGPGRWTVLSPDVDEALAQALQRCAGLSK